MLALQGSRPNRIGAYCVALAVSAFLLVSPARATDVTIFAAASLTEVMEEITDRFKKKTRLRSALSFAGSSVLARQIRQGAPADVMVSANREWMDHLEDGNALARGTRIPIAGNRLVIVTRADNAEAPDSLEGIVLDTGARVAVGDPDHVPVGIYTRQALTELEQWDALRTRIAPAGNTRSALAFVQRGAARYGIVYATDAQAFPDVRVIYEIPTDTHDPILYEAAITFQGQALNRENATRFFEFLNSPEALEVFAGAGFSLCNNDNC